MFALLAELGTVAVRHRIAFFFKATKPWGNYLEGTEGGFKIEQTK